MSAIHTVFIILAVIGSACTDFMFIMLIVNVPVLSNIFNENLSELNEMLREEDMNMLFVKAKLRNILLMHREFCDVIDVLDVAFFNICFVQISSAAISAAIELFICLKIQFFPAIGLAVSLLGQIVGFSAVGTVVEICNSQVYDSIIEGDWFSLSRSDQQVYMFLMKNAQTSKALTVRSIAPLNMQTCVAILKTIYSYLMILYTFF
ncbi:putative odorant receptor 83c [Contarinia nasturtii]|uniref:putative odorant receptor 83c n=1 Tax=Contarinia nasturtii TaxID=265458 RepID=UPI0012D495A6|nr:putative odorant receptor 83c [Contarinia nasturtii]